MIRGLIETPSVSAIDPTLDMSNRSIIDLLAGWLEGLGFQIEILPVDEARAKYNLVATLGKGNGGLVLSGHTDTVPCNPKRWSSDPFKLIQTDERLYGLGTSDMKSFLALAIESARDVSRARLNRPLVILATADEETGMSGAKALVKAGKPPGRYAVIGEPTGMRPVRMHKGIMMEAIRIEGRSGHSSDPALGASALEAMHKVIDELLRWRTELGIDHRDPHFAVPFPTLNLGHIHGGDSPNRICGDCELQIDLRPLPGMQLDTLRDTLRDRIRNTLRDSDVKVKFKALVDGVPALETDAQSAIVRAAETLTNHKAESVAFGTEGPYFQQLGMESVVLGPGDVAQAHQPDEFLHMDRLQPTILVLKRLIHQFCMSG